MKIIRTKKGIAIKVDDRDYAVLAKYKWHLVSNGHRLYAGRINQLMHRQILMAKAGEYIDHINGDGLDNQRSNLRICTMSQNQGNRIKAKAYSSKFKGVTKYRNKWQAQLRTKTKFYYGGLHLTEEEAAKAYNRLAKAYFGEFALLNIL